jgi:hypothetical protein|nr:MAG TPA: hypothetical protein [Caudoviricetes sp.]
MTEFINGVEYLYTIPAEEPTSYWILVAIFFIAFALFGIMFLVYSFWGGFEDIVAALLLAAIATLLSFFAIKSNNVNELLPERYAVNISDEVSMNEFTDNYTIVEQKGNVYIIEVKDNEHD